MVEVPANTAKDVGVRRLVEVSSMNESERGHTYGWGMAGARGDEPGGERLCR